MGVYTRTGSPYYWLYLERPGEKGIRENTRIPFEAATQITRNENRQLADDFYAIRMAELARDRLLRARDTKSIPFTDAVPIPPALKITEDSPWCYVYFVQRGPMVKIGKTADVERRIESLQTANHEPLQLLAAIPAHGSLERAIHLRFAEWKKGGEWFQLVPPLTDFILRLKTGVNPVALLVESTQS